MEKETKYLSVKEAAKKAEVTEWTVRRWIREEKLPARKKKYGKRHTYLITEKDLDKFLHDNFRIL